MFRQLRLYLLLFLSGLAIGKIANAQQSDVNKIMTVRDGLPQSYVSGIVQDRNGFLWVSTLNGLGRYDGRGFMHYQYQLADSTGLSENIILHIFDTGNDNLLVCYNDGRVDLFNTDTEKAIHLWKYKGFELLKNSFSYFKSLMTTGGSICWMMDRNQGLFRIDVKNRRVKYLSLTDLKTKEPILGIATRSGKLMFLTQSALTVCNANGNTLNSVAYPFKTLTEPVNDLATNIYSPAVRKNGDLIIADKAGIKIWNPATGYFKAIPLTGSQAPSKLVASFDREGNYFFEFNGDIYKLTSTSTLIKWSAANAAVKGIPTNMLVDRSDVLWAGTNGFGLRQYNLIKTGLTGFENKGTFVTDVLNHYGISRNVSGQTFLKSSVPFANRSATIKDSVWISDVNYHNTNPTLVLFNKEKIAIKSFYKINANPTQLCDVQYLSGDSNGNLWGIDQDHCLLKFDTQVFTCRALEKINTGIGEEINGMVCDAGGIFYISTSRNLYKFNIATGITKRITPLLPATNPLYVVNDPSDTNILWIGTLSEGMIRLDKTTRKTQLFNMATGLPNNTIYTILPGNDGLLWCSSNKGIFAFNQHTQAVISFTSKDGLFDDEFNRYYYMCLPGGDLAFGGPLGYAIFNPAKLKTDDFEPRVMLTDLNIINKPPVENINDVKELRLADNQNFITATFAGMQFDVPEKLRYRYMLEGLDKGWIMADNENRALYTSLPPGTYTLKLNATNTAGKWSRYIKQLKIVISPPYWQTWWFYLLVILLIALTVYLIVKFRVQSIRKVQVQRLRFEREAMELHALALRARMNPHFIFNCLNSIKALIQEHENQKAVTYLTTFSSLIRKQLNNTGNEIYLQDEIETCRMYLELEALRFEGRIGYKIDIEDQSLLTQLKVPALLLQPIVENAIVHGLLPSEEGGTVSIRVYRDGNAIVCKIKDNGIGRAAAESNKLRSNRLHQSKGMNLLDERITIHNNLRNNAGSLQTTDLFDTDGKAAGTLVVIKFNIEL